MNIGEVMSLNVPAIGLEDDIATAGQIMRDMDSNELVVMDGGKIVGVITDREIARGCVVDGHVAWQCPVFRHMIIQDYTVSPETHIGNAAIAMIDKDISILPVVEEGTLVGIVSSSDLFEAVDREEISHSALSVSMI